MSMSDETLKERYREVYGDKMSEDKLKEYVYYQKLIHEARSQGKKFKRLEKVEVIDDDSAEEGIEQGSN